MNSKHFKNGVLVREIRNGISITDNLGKTPLELSAQRVAMPSMFRQASGVAQAVTRLIKAAVNQKRVMVSDEEKERRLSICYECEFYMKGRCAKCGCYINLKNRLESEHCPIKKW